MRLKFMLDVLEQNFNHSFLIQFKVSKSLYMKVLENQTAYMQVCILF